MKVVLFCGGLGMRLREYSDSIPKPMVKIGQRPILWHLMKYYAHYGHKDFILCLGYKAEVIKDYFLNYNDYMANDFTMLNGTKELHQKKSDITDWKITFVNTGLKSNIGQRLKMVEKYLDGEEMFLANYADGLTDYPLSGLVNKFSKSRKVGCFLCVRPPQTFHVVKLGENNLIDDIKWVQDTDIIVNGGFFVLRKEIFQYISDKEDLVGEPFLRLIGERKLIGFRCDRFWCMDTFKEYQELSDLDERGAAPWKVWEHSSVL
jgi:glucose-1-phosphate cytidylyltransferase